MNVFIDTSVIYTDPFWKRNFSKQLLDAARLKRLNIFIADVVVRELRKNYKSNLDEELTKLSNTEKSLNKLSINELKIKAPDTATLLKEFDKFYKDIFKRANIYKLDSNKKFFDEILERAIQERKPFTKTKVEFKDAVIWTTYYTYAKKEKLLKCFLLTNNKSDFTNGDGELHDELKKDYNKFKVHVTIDEFYKENNATLDKPVTEFENWLTDKKLDERYIQDLIVKDDDASERIFYELDNKYRNIDPTAIEPKLKFSTPFNGYIMVGGVQWLGCKNFEVDIISDYAIISGTLLIIPMLQLIAADFSNFNANDPYHSFISPQLTISFNFRLDKKNEFTNFEVTKIKPSSQ